MAKDGAQKRITIIGLGLIGGSIGLALKKAGLPGVQIVGHDREHGTEAVAERMGAIDKGEHNLPRAVEGAPLVIIATPVLSVREVMQQIAGHLAEGAVVTDTASTKAHVMKWARELLPAHVSFVGGHPMAGKENQGIVNAEADLFRYKAYCICPSVAASEGAVKSVVGLAQLLAAEPLFIDPDEHDVYAAAVSHLPLMVASALFNVLRTSPSWPDMSLMASSGLKDTTRLASGDPRMAHDIWVTNREAVIHWLERMEGELRRFRDILQDSRDQELLETFAKTQLDRDTLMKNPPKRQMESTGAVEKGGQALMDMLIGKMMADQLRKVQKIPELMSQPIEVPDVEGKGTVVRPSRTEKIAEDLRRDLEKLEQKRAEKEARKKGDQ
ncbi:MAG TPA: prephenate dehydrogenase/arogenate dehydrogenase family protein [Dehalococcoidia bacterium]|nr:prephenate dehydrogenase/arogenate dehydrogenase family protein [Dehalococcoidia bacterium]